ncbi:minor tail protein [Arthrobacter phage Iter]|uniref:Minor tail protein n=1 Tax=Arthrobacter phage Ascela TaxID=3038360 RepID=A0AAF0GJ95_9CAUD|nr:minor tail protein [Arthrobacter phage Iter]WGH21540.1 minor tail protein [Arthrobacter phage Ascela]
MPSPQAWRLTYPGEDLAFGSIESGYVFTTAPDLGAREIEHEDERRPRSDGVTFGQDFTAGRTITFELDVNGADEADAKAKLARLSRAWRADVVRSTPGATATLTSGSGRVAFGRPRRFASNDDLQPHGLSTVVADFAAADDTWYGGTEQGVTVSLVPAPSGGLMAPLAAPLSTTRSSDRSQGVTIGGEMPTWPVFEIQGPITDPTVELVGALRMDFKLVLAYDQKLVIDTRPWARTILRNGASVAGAITRTSTRLAHAALAPGAYEFVLRGSANTGNPSATIRWREAYITP